MYTWLPLFNYREHFALSVISLVYEIYRAEVAFHLSVLIGRKGLVSVSLKERSKVRAYIFPATTLQIPALWPTERESWEALIHKQGHSDQNQFWELVRSS